MDHLPPQTPGVNPQISDDHSAHTNAVLAIAEDDLRRRIAGIEPLIGADVQVMASVLRETVELERAKLALASAKSALQLVRITLYPDKVPRADIDPCLVGTFNLAKSKFMVRAWIVAGAKSINLEIKAL